MEEPRKGEDIARVVRDVAHIAAQALGRAGDAAATALEGIGRRGVRGSHEPLESRVLPHTGQAEPADAGDEVRLRVHLVNSGKNATEPFRLRATQLKSSSGEKIPASAVEVPKHQRVVAGKSSDHVPVTVKVPAGAKPGTYTGKLNGGPEPAELSIVVA